MHDIEPYYHWRDLYIASEDENSPFYGRTYSEFVFTNKIYNYFIHPQWDGFGSPTLYTKILFVDYDEGFAIMEMIGEWNDAINNDIMFLKRDVIDPMLKHNISKYIIVAENVLNFHADGDDYYEEWGQDTIEENGWVCILNSLEHVEEEMKDARLELHVHFGEPFVDIKWRIMKPQQLYGMIKQLLQKQTNRLTW